MSPDLLTRARAGDGEAFARLVDGHRRELEVHCYRMLGSAQDAEDALQLIERLTRAYEVGDLRSIVELLADDVLFSMPPLPLEYVGRDLAARFLEVIAFREGRTYRIVPTRANGQLAFAVYLRDVHSDVLHANGLMVLALAGDRIAAMVRFDSSVFGRFGFPRTWPD